ncbi:MAG: single-stranded DNA-binding protein [Ferruginibacter sp.]
MIKLFVIGHLGKDCSVNNVNGKTVINFNVAHTEKYKDSMGVQHEKTTWVECAYWTDRTNIAPYLKKGTQVYAEGTPEVKSYQTQDGKQGVTLALRINNVQLLGTKNNSSDGNSGAEHTSSTTNNYNTPQTTERTPSVSHNEITEPVDDLPF